MATIKSQRKTFGPREFSRDGRRYRITVEVSHDDQCGNGHNTFAITANIDVMRGNQWREDSGGCCHDEVAKYFPKLAPFIKWHLTSTDGPMHYVANTIYWLGWSGWCDGKPTSPPNLEHARSTAVWPELPAEWIAPATLPASKAERAALVAPIEAALNARLAGLLADFRAAVESLGFTY